RLPVAQTDSGFSAMGQARRRWGAVSGLKSFAAPHKIVSTRGRGRPRSFSVSNETQNQTALDRARRKAYWRLLPLLFLCYVVAYVDRANVAIAKLTMAKDLPNFDSAVFGFGAGMFFWGYFLLEIPGSLLVEKWSARKWICRIMLTWGLMAALTAAVKTPMHFYIVRFLLG